MRFTKVKDGAHIGRVGRHNFRTGKPSEGVDTSRSHLNEYIGVQSVKELHAGVKTAIATATRKPRPDASKMIEFFCGASPEFFENKTDDDSKAYLYDCYGWACETFGHENVVGAQFHFDEKTPHVHIEVVPMANTIKKTKHTETQERTLNSAHWMDGKKKMEDLQTSFAKFVQDRGHALERGEPKAERLAMGGNVKHKPVRQWHAEQISEAKNITTVAEEILTNAAHEEKRAADARRDAEKTKAKAEQEQKRISEERGLTLLNAWAMAKYHKKEGRYLEWWEDRNRKKEEAQEKWDAELKARADDLDKLTGGLAAVPAHQITTWQAPSYDEQKMLDFLAKNPRLAALMKEAQANDSVADVLAGIQKDMEDPGMHAVDSGEDWEAKLKETDKPKARTVSHSQGYGLGS